ncbi:hypothetical protein SPRG_09217 [Saprolegnia parasitica CBS 223.65]|uniref:Uncharacterized protein n=1 Tax=Saprolegnia parasitica (strain CBS 223.65) TaxID=695850 RepID=A0A067CE37_SAPPC|nr:hypothetical protein SPRG_09217 [Saprolegnia parasitica CBS 223.65]KDO25077.1 hypothetical protein SPRG_09217 [Saprolegnia parasitica CBS 223.65]|eukprot:XP_012204151.1 hypothetical protein SPRG_09217 [Saprolegnia parasitica CBS 223.65]
MQAPIVLTCDDGKAMVVATDKASTVSVVESRFLLDGAEYLYIEPIDGAHVHLVSMHQRKRYLSAQPLRSALVWSARASPKSVFRIVSASPETFCLESVHWPQQFVRWKRAHSSRALGHLVLKRQRKHATAFTAMDAARRDQTLLRRRHETTAEEVDALCVLEPIGCWDADDLPVAYRADWQDAAACRAN